MPDSHDPAVVAQDTRVIVKFWHTLAGLYIWEFVTTFDYEWSVIRGHRPYRFSIWIYSVARVTTLVAVILCIVGLDYTPPFNCQLLVTFEFVSAFVAIVAASLLIALIYAASIAIWNRNRVIIITALLAWGTNISLFIHGKSLFRSTGRRECSNMVQKQLRSVWVPDQETCIRVNVEKTTVNLSFIFVFITDIVLLSIMLAGLLRLRRHGGGSFGLARLLWKQGLIWLLLAIVAEVPPLVLLILNLNVPFDLMFQLPALITMSIAATRMHRALVDFVSRPTEFKQEPAGDIISKTNPTTAAPIRFKRMEVAMHTVCEHHPTLQMSHQSSCINISAEGQRPDKPYEVSLEHDLERGVEKEK
ncbi:hypothetical protein BJV74DRAFT_886495 [Russula compacta]|nr:hypothetical protein BJV74DRAFT_886495 [Russula compacta]